MQAPREGSEQGAVRGDQGSSSRCQDLLFPASSPQLVRGQSSSRGEAGLRSGSPPPPQAPGLTPPATRSRALTPWVLQAPVRPCSAHPCVRTAVLATLTLSLSPSLTAPSLPGSSVPAWGLLTPASRGFVPLPLRSGRGEEARGREWAQGPHQHLHQCQSFDAGSPGPAGPMSLLRSSQPIPGAFDF